MINIKNSVINKKINNEITSNLVRVSLLNGKQLGILSLKEALLYAKKIKLDLIEINNNINPPICKIMDYKKYLYKQSKFKNKKNKKIIIKEIKLRPFIDNGDYLIKLNKINNFLNKGNKVKITINFKGRELFYYKDSFHLLERLKNDLKELINIEYYSDDLDNKQLLMIITSIKKKK